MLIKITGVGNVLSKHKFWTDDTGVQLQNPRISFNSSCTTGGVLDILFKCCRPYQIFSLK